jgi:Zn-dependent hydrolases, including glyoxylases
MEIKFITKNIFIINDGNARGFTTGGIKSNQGTILIGCDDRLTPADISVMNLPEVKHVFCCDYRRSCNAGILNFDDAEKYVNGNHRTLLTDPELWWDDPKNRWHLYQLKNDDDILPYGASKVNEVTADKEIVIGDIKITALLTPGDTDYSMSYLVEDEGVKVIFCGGLLHQNGTIPYLYRLTQNLLIWQNDSDYHGFLGGITTWQKSLETISHADIAVPYLGGIIHNLKEAIKTFEKNIGEYYNYYTDISALNYYFDCLKVNPETQFKRAVEKKFPSYIVHVDNQCNIVRSKNGNAIAIDNYNSNATDKLLSMIEYGEIKSIDTLYITHYHDDHVDGCGYFREYFSCPIYADKSFADIIKNPIRYRLPCISPVNVDVTPLDDGHSWIWEEFEFTSFEFPGQTLYHGGLMVRNTDNGEIVFFAGDSFTPSGIDDYCAYNRNLLIPDEGYFKCVDILKKYMPDYIINQHVDNAFCFNHEQLKCFEENLLQRMSLLSKLSVWDNINYALDEYFLMAYPYEQDDIDNVRILISDYADNIRYEIIAPKQTIGKNIYGIRVYIGDIYLGQKACFIVNRK